MSNSIPIPTPATGAEMILSDAGRRYTAGQKLTLADENMATLASAQENSSRFGPTVREFTVERPALPESVKGSLVEHST